MPQGMKVFDSVVSGSVPGGIERHVQGARLDWNLGDLP